MWIFFPLPECLLPVFCLSPLFKVVLTLTALWIITLLWNFAVEKTVAWAEGDFYSIYLEGNQSIALNWTSPVLWKILLWTNRGSFILRAGHTQFKISVIFWTRNKLKFHFWFDMICRGRKISIKIKCEFAYNLANERKLSILNCVWLALRISDTLEMH